MREKQFEEFSSGLNRKILFKAKAEFNVQLSREEDFWKQKAGLEWFKDCERSTKFFHTVVNGIRNQLKEKRIHNNEGEWMEDWNQIAESVIQFFRYNSLKGKRKLILICWINYQNIE